MCTHGCQGLTCFAFAAARWPEVRFFGGRVNPLHPPDKPYDDRAAASLWEGRLTTQLELSAFDPVRDGLLVVLCDGQYVRNAWTVGAAPLRVLLRVPRLDGAVLVSRHTKVFSVFPDPRNHELHRLICRRNAGVPLSSG